MLTSQEEQFVRQWEVERRNKQRFLKRFSIGLPLFALLAVAFFINFLSGWYGRADNELRSHSSLIVVILVAVVAIGVFVIIFTARQKFEQNEADYQSLLKKKSTPPSTSEGGH